MYNYTSYLTNDFKEKTLLEFDFKPCKDLPPNKARDILYKSSENFKQYVTLNGLCLDAKLEDLEKMVVQGTSLAPPQIEVYIYIFPCKKNPIAQACVPVTDLTGI